MVLFGFILVVSLDRFIEAVTLISLSAMPILLFWY